MRREHTLKAAGAGAADGTWGSDNAADSALATYYQVSSVHYSHGITVALLIKK